MSNGSIKVCTEVWCAELLMLRLGHIQCFPLIFLSLAVNPGAGYAGVKGIGFRV